MLDDKLSAPTWFFAGAWFLLMGRGFIGRGFSLIGGLLVRISLTRLQF
jgi:hypothetical protein